MDTSTYVDDSELTKYVWNNYQHLFSRLEQLGAKAVMAEDKANSASSLAMADLLRKKWEQKTTLKLSLRWVTERKYLNGEFGSEWFENVATVYS